VYTIRTARATRATLGRRRTSTACLAWRMVAVLQAHANESVLRENAQGRTSVIEILLFEIRLIVPIYWVLGWGAETAAASHYVIVGQNMRETTVIPATS
jgi:hypothetical protein